MEQVINQMVLFETVRKVRHNGEYYFSVVDAMSLLAGSERPRKYWSDLKVNLKKEGFEVSEKIGQLKMTAEDGKLRETDCVNTETMLRIIQSIPSPNVEPFKAWLAQVGKDRILEEQHPELAIERAIAIYKRKGYSDEWIGTRIRSKCTYKDLTEEYKKRKITEGWQYGALANVFYKETFEMNSDEYKEFKGLKKEILRDHMDTLELAFVCLGEAMAKRIITNKNAQGFEECKERTKEGAEFAGNARKDAEVKLGEKVSTSRNFLNCPELENHNSQRRLIPF